MIGKKSEVVEEFYKEKVQDRLQKIREIEVKSGNRISKLKIWLLDSNILHYLVIFLSSFKDIEFNFQTTQEKRGSYVNT